MKMEEEEDSVIVEWEDEYQDLVHLSPLFIQAFVLEKIRD